MIHDPQHLLVDGTFFLHRILHLPAFATLTTTDGRPTGGVFGFINSIKTTLSQFPTIDHCYVCWDSGRSQRRLKLFPSYKANRDITPDMEPHKRREKEEYQELFNGQKRAVQAGLSSLGIRQLALPDREADDIIGWMVHHRPVPKVIASDDMDMLQLVYDYADVYQPIKKMRVTAENFFQITGIPKPLFLLSKAILGDKSDNIPGVEKVGDTVGERIMKKVAELWSAQGEQRNPLSKLLVAACEGLKETDKRNKKKYQSAIDSDDRIRQNLALMSIAQEVATFTDTESEKLGALIDLPANYNEVKFIEFSQQMEFNSVLQNRLAWTQRFTVLR